MTNPIDPSLLRPLVWEPMTGEDGATAKAPAGCYHVFEAGYGWMWYLTASHFNSSMIAMGGERAENAFSTIEAAQAAAQADCAARASAIFNPAALATMLAKAEQRGREAEREAIAAHADHMALAVGITAGVLRTDNCGLRGMAEIMAKKFAEFAAAIRARANGEGGE
jgi:hypothetical protein